MAMIHDLKCWGPDPFQAVWDGRKTAEFRRDDRGFSVGDDLLLREYEPGEDGGPGYYTGREITVEVTDIRSRGRFGVPDGYAMLSFRVLSRTEG